MPPDVWRKIQDGHKFNVERRPHYASSEVRLGTGKVVDSYDHEEEIVERKHSQLARIRSETAIGYLQDTVRKYSPGRKISDTPRNRELYPDLVGKILEGRLILEVPVQDDPVARAVLEKAAELDVIIRDVEGKEYHL